MKSADYATPQQAEQQLVGAKRPVRHALTCLACASRSPTPSRAAAVPANSCYLDHPMVVRMSLTGGQPASYASPNARNPGSNQYQYFPLFSYRCSSKTVNVSATTGI